MAVFTGLAIRVRDLPSDAQVHLASQGTVATNGRVEPEKKAGKKNIGDKFAQEYGSFNTLDSWVKLCRDLGVEGRLTSKTQCKKALGKTFVNIRDFLDAVGRRKEDADKLSDPSEKAAALEAPVKVHHFETEAALSAYTLRSRRMYPLILIKQTKDHPFRLLMRNIKNRRGGN